MVECVGKNKDGLVGVAKGQVGESLISKNVRGGSFGEKEGVTCGEEEIGSNSLGSRKPAFPETYAIVAGQKLPEREIFVVLVGERNQDILDGKIVGSCFSVRVGERKPLSVSGNAILKSDMGCLVHEGIVGIGYIFAQKELEGIKVSIAAHEEKTFLNGCGTVYSKNEQQAQKDENPSVLHCVSSAEKPY